jgi:hypothetical protein
MWGNDPSVNSPEGCVPGAGGGDPHACPALSETWINPQAPAYSKETLGWGGRLSGPNDGAVDIMAAVQNADGKGSTPYNGRYAMSSCQSCHGPAEYKTQSFLLPVSSTCKGDSCQPDVVNGRLVYFPAGSPSFSNWFQDRAGNVPQDSGSTALDYDMDYSFKAIPAWFKQTGQPGTLRFIEAFNNYFGLGTNITRKGLLVGPTSSTNP